MREAFWTNSGAVLREATLKGAGISLLATVLAGVPLSEGKLVRVLPDWTPDLSEDPQRSIFAVYPDNLWVPAKVRAFVAFLAERIGDPPYWDEGL